MTRVGTAATSRARARPLAAVAPVLVLLTAWSSLAVGAGVLLALLAPPAGALGWGALVVTAALVGLALLAGLRQLLLLIAAQVHRAPPAPRLLPAAGARVALLYPTADDFRADVIQRSARQTHPHTRTVVLDDSSLPETRERVGALARSGGIEVHRRGDRTGAKAGNLNAWLDAHGDEVDYVVVLDADQEVGDGFVSGALARFAAHPEAAVVQGRIRSRSGETSFARDFSGLFTRHADTKLAARSALGVVDFCGRGAMLDVAALRDAGGFPEVVMEDTALTVELERHGQAVVAAPELVSVEDTPVDHTAFAVQFGKFAEGAVQLLARSSRSMFDTRLRVRRRVDVALELLVPVLAAVVPLAVFGYSVVGAATGVEAFPWQLGLPLAALSLVPLLPEALHRARTSGIIRGLAFTARASMLYASIGIVAARAVVAVAISGRARFRITPKERAERRASVVVRRRAPELIAAGVAIAVAVLSAGRPELAAPFIVIAATAIAFGWRDAVGEPAGEPVR
ncbi:glycosyltransferase family 2 protein [Agrococcus sp. Marseille-P2731]|uniref:glycosyltransferase family 2 protein n=1 Tax=Agrococcus sp. Marseille-P2731 TaxID=1841862 RepID=UPI000930049F|nr:glycosyltransferase family 2 protein [Agrococcus sp. Marseille-P2731]